MRENLWIAVDERVTTHPAEGRPGIGTAAALAEDPGGQGLGATEARAREQKSSASSAATPSRASKTSRARAAALAGATRPKRPLTMPRSRVSLA
ncbi:MAG: hypothetical protein ACHQ7H_21945 [Candidatus Rokuibacteriota bacterium]|jgi:hypothetical protein